MKYNAVVKKIVLLVFVFMGIVSSIGMISVKASNDVFVPSYSVNAPDMSNEELLQYYIDNGIHPSTPPSGTTDRIVGESEVEPHLTSRFPDYTTWTKVANGSNSVAFSYGDIPVEISEWDSDIQVAKDLAGLNQNYIGCGPLALVSQLDYFARNVGYTSLAKDPDFTYDKRILAKEIFEEVPTIPADSFLGQLFGVDPNAGTFTLPRSFIYGSHQVLKNHYLAIQKTGIDEDGEEYTYYDNDSQVVVYGDTLPSLNSFSVKIENIKDSIDHGMPVIWWTFGDAGDYSDHYMNIYAYENWVGTDSNGNTMTHLMFKLRFNWGETQTIYMDSQLLDAVNGGFVFFEETHDKVLINPSDYGYECQYFFYELEKYVTPSVGNETFYTNRLRTGYVDHYDSTNSYVDAQYLVLSAKREGAGEAYLEYAFNRGIDWIYFDVRWWSSYEQISQYSGEALFQYKDANGNWVTAIDLQSDIPYPYLSTLEDYPTKLYFRFDEPIYEFRFYVQSDYPTGTRNKGRLVIGEINVFFDE